MSSTTLTGDAQEIGGNVKQGAGKVLGDSSLQGEGVADQVIGNARQIAGSAIDAVQNPGPLIDKAKTFAKQRPYATAALVGVLALATFNSLRGK